MIPKTIHYCWFGGNELPESVRKCIESWKKYCPDFVVKEWNESNYDVNKIPFMKEAYEAKKYAFVSDYARLDIIYQHGGIYLDTDVELIRPLDDRVLDTTCFMGMETPGTVATGLGFGAIKGHSFIKQNRDVYHTMSFNTSSLITCVEVTTNLLKDKGLTPRNEEQIVGEVTIFPTEFFCPLNMETNKMNITPETYSIHHYDATWYGTGFKSQMKRKLLPYKMKAKKYVDKVFGEGTYSAIKSKLK